MMEFNIKIIYQFLFVVIIGSALVQGCTVTTVSGTKAPATFCAGDLIFEDNFDTLDLTKWQHEETLGGGGNWEFQWYSSSPNNSYTKDGKLYLMPTLTADEFGEEFLTSGTATIPPNVCTNPEWYGCERQGSPNNIINPIRSALLNSRNTFAFKYGIIEVRAQAPSGDWIWPAIWMMPKESVYGGWPRSGEMDIMETRGNLRLYNGNINVGTEQTGSTMHYGPAPNINGWEHAHGTKNRVPPFNEDYHIFSLNWTPDHITFLVDGNVVLNINTDSSFHGFWAHGRFQNSGMENPWTERNAPFNQEFYIILNNAIGGVNYFSDMFYNVNNPKPWSNDSPQASTDFWNARQKWLPTWQLNTTTNAALKVDSVRVYAV